MTYKNTFHLILLILVNLSFIYSEFSPKFYSFQNGLDFGSHEKNALAIKEIGFHGVSQVFVKGDALKECVIAYEKVGLNVLSVYLDVHDKPIPALQVKALQNRDAMIELTVRKMSSATVEAIRNTAEMASKLNIRVALYPHHGFAIATMPQALDMIEKVNHPNLGVMFNLCHFLKNENVDNLESLIEKANKALFAVSISGGTIGGKNWGELIQTLDRGDFPQERLFKALNNIGFSGPVGLQCYGIKGDKRKNLENSMKAWKALKKEF